MKFESFSAPNKTPDVLQPEDAQDSLTRPSPQVIRDQIINIEQKLRETSNENVRAVLLKELESFRRYRKEQDVQQEYTAWKPGDELQNIPILEQAQEDKYPLFHENARSELTQTVEDLDDEPSSKTFAEY